MRLSARQPGLVRIQKKQDPGLSGKRSEDILFVRPFNPSAVGVDSSTQHGPLSFLLNSPGQPLEPATRSRLESSFGHDFSRVRIHCDDPAASSAEALGALAYTAGSNVIFARDRYRPEQTGGAALLAHELTHVVQQSGSQAGSQDLLGPEGPLENEADRMAQRVISGERSLRPSLTRGAVPFSVQRQAVSGTRSSIPLYELGGTLDSASQTLTGTSSTGNAVLQLSYDPATTNFYVTFPLVWIFPHTWSDSQRTNYVDDFTDAVERVWNDRFILNETVAPSRTAHVHVLFSSIVITQGASAADESARLLTQSSGRWLMDVRNLAIQENVDRATSTVQLGATSNRAQSRNAATLRSMASFSISGTGGNRTFSQAASPHEFGHMIGLGDEYLEDVAGAAVPSAVRGQINDRIMNVGENVTADAYAPFVDWLSGLTSTRWRVGRRVR